MGAEQYETTVEATTDQEAVTAFQEVVKQCEYDYGHAGYSGTFAEKDSLKILPVPEGRDFWTEDEIRNHPEGEDKWGDAIGGRISETRYFLFGWCSC